MSEESNRMMILLQELAELRKADESERNSISAKRRRREISQEMKLLASQSKKAQE